MLFWRDCGVTFPVLPSGVCRSRNLCPAPYKNLRVSLSPSGVASIRLTSRGSRLSSFFLIAEIFVKLGEKICAEDAGGLDTGVLELKVGAALCWDLGGSTCTSTLVMETA